jgi:hypothetical protein
LLALAGAHHFVHVSRIRVNPLNAKLNPIRHLLALAGAHHFVHVSRIRVNVASNNTMYLVLHEKSPRVLPDYNQFFLIALAQVRDRWQTIVNAVINLRGSTKCGEFLGKLKNC